MWPDDDQTGGGGQGGVAGGPLGQPEVASDEDPGVAEKVGNLASGIFGGNADWALLKKTFVGLALGGLGWLAIVVMRPRRH